LCAANQTRSTVNGVPVCTCKTGFAGTPTWVVAEQRWSDVCTAVSCAAFQRREVAADGALSCVCRRGYTGRPAFTNDQTWTDVCQGIPLGTRI
jgi:hypothetical protein